MTRLTTHLTLSPDAAIDLQLHTTYSDGRWSARELIAYLAAEHFDLVAITDHDRVDKVAEIQALGAEKNLPVLSAVEMSTEWSGKMGDLLCFGFDPERNELAPLAEKTVQLQLENTHEVNERLRSQGYSFPRQEEVLANHEGKLRRPSDNIRLLVEHGYADYEAARRLIRDAGYYPVRNDMAQVVDAAHRSGAVCLIAHPGRRERGFTFYDIPLLDQLRRDVPIDGIEVIHPKHSQESTAAYLAYVREHDLLASTGSDSHGNPDRPPIKHRAEISRRLLERVGITVA